MVGVLLLAVSCSEGSRSSPRAEVPEETPAKEAMPEVSDPLLAAAEEIAPDLGISVEAALAILKRQPRVGRLQSALASKGPDSYGGTFVEYDPEYRIVLHALPGGAEEVTRAVDELGFADLSRFVSVRETPYSEEVLREAQRMVGELGGSKVTSLDRDIRTGEILATVASSEDADAVTAAIDAADPPVPAPVVVTVATGGGDQ